MDEKDKKEYELAVLVKTEDDLTSVTALVRQHNGEVTAEPHAKKLAFAYEIKKIKEGVFAYILFTSETGDIKNLEKDLRTAPTVIRSMVIASPVPMSRPSERPTMPAGGSDAPVRRGVRTMHTTRTGTDETRPAPAPTPLSNEALEKKIEEILG